MPELPEVETIRRQLQKKIVGKKLNGRKISAVRRRAKVLMIDFADDSSLLFHLKLTGQLIFNPSTRLGAGSPLLKYTRKIFKFDDGSKLIFNDTRKFGWWKFVKDTKKIEQNFGPEALTVDLSTFRDLFKKRPHAKIKPLLMDQKVIAGIGNIYSDEILFASRVHPLRQVKTLKDPEIKIIYQNVKKVLQKAIQCRGTTAQYYRDACGREGGYYNLLKVYQREGRKCPRCGAIIKRVKLAGRSAHFCPKCQR